MDKSWIEKPKSSRVYVDGVAEFIKFATDNSYLPGRKILCPCQKCYFRDSLFPQAVQEHLLCNGFLRGYTVWVFHGESISPAANNNNNNQGDGANAAAAANAQVSNAPSRAVRNGGATPSKAPAPEAPSGVANNKQAPSRAASVAPSRARVPNANDVEAPNRAIDCNEALSRPATPGPNLQKRKDTTYKIMSHFCVWTIAMDDALVDAFLHQHNLGNRIDGNFTTQAYENVLLELKEQFLDKPLDKEKIKDRMEKIKKSFVSCYECFKNGLEGFTWNSYRNMWVARPRFWQRLIKDKPEAAQWKNKSIRNYNKLEQLFVNYLDTREHADVAAGAKQQRATSGEVNIMDVVNDINQMVFQNDSRLEGFDVNEDEQNVASFGEHCQLHSQGEQSPKSKKCKPDFVIIKEGLEKIADAIMKSTALLIKSNQRLPILANDIWAHLVELGVERSLMNKMYPFLVQKPDMLRALLGCPLENH